MNDKVMIVLRCHMCNVELSIEADLVGYNNWVKYQEPIQDALPDLSADDREALISRTCSKCFDKLTREW